MTHFSAFHLTVGPPVEEVVKICNAKLGRVGPHFKMSLVLVSCAPKARSFSKGPKYQSKDPFTFRISLTFLSQDGVDRRSRITHHPGQQWKAFLLGF